MYVRASIFYLDTEKQSCVRFNIHPNLSCHCTSHGWCANVWATIFFFSSHNGIDTHEWQPSLHSVIIWRAVRTYRRNTVVLLIDLKSIAPLFFFNLPGNHMITNNWKKTLQNPKKWLNLSKLHNTHRVWNFSSESLHTQPNIFMYLNTFFVLT